MSSDKYTSAIFKEEQLPSYDSYDFGKSEWSLLMSDLEVCGVNPVLYNDDYMSLHSFSR